MKVVRQVFCALMIAPASADLTGSVNAIDKPIELSYRDLEATRLTGSLAITLFKQGQKVRAHAQTFEATISSRTVGHHLELTLSGTDDRNQTIREVCLMRRTGEVLKCTRESRVTFPLYERVAYKTGDPMTLPFLKIDGIARVTNGTVRGTSVVGDSQVLVVDFTDRRVEKIGSTDIVWDTSGYFYIDLATGYPVEADVSADVTGALSPEFDRLQMHMKQIFTRSVAAN